MPAPSKHHYYSARLKLNYVDWGNHDAPPLILIHGRMDHCRNWDWVAQRLADRYHIIAPDLRGHGDSDWAIGNAYSMYDYIYDLCELIEQLQLAPVTLIGHSLGGGIATKFTGAYPDQVTKLVSIEGLGSAPDFLEKEASISASEKMQRWTKEMQRIAAKPERQFATREQAIERMQQANAHLSEERARHLALQGICQKESGQYRWKYDPYVGAHPPFDMSAQDTHQLWETIACPVLLVWGKESWASDPAEDGRVDYFKDAKVTSIPDAGHWVHHDQCELFMGEIESFLS